MTSPTRILLVEDSHDDEVLIVRALRKHGLDFVHHRVDSRDAFLRSLNDESWDVVVIDYSLPGFSGTEALTLAKKSFPLLPTILISGTIGEELAVELIKSGADDYLLKHSLVRLGPAIVRAIRESKAKEQQAAVEKELHENRNRLELIVNNVSDILLFLTRDNDRWTISSFNHAFEMKGRQLGIQDAAEKVIGMDIVDFERLLLRMDADSIEWFKQQRQLAVDIRLPQTFHREIHFPTGVSYLEFSFIPILDANGNTRNLLVDMSDMTAQWRAEQQAKIDREQLIQAQRLEALGTLAGGIAHDFNNLLTGIYCFAELAKESSELTVAHEYCEEVRLIADQAKELVGRILTFSRRAPLNRTATCLNRLVQGMIPLIQVSLPSTIQLEVQLPESGPSLMADAAQLHQVVLNLCTNAIHAMPNGGRLSIALQVVRAELAQLIPGLYARLSVSDTGTGMDSDTIRRAFEPFFTTKPLGRGTGLGLSVTHGIVLEHGGTTRILSEKDHGTTVEVYLPLASQAEPAAQ